MKTQTEKLNVRDFVTIAILTVVELAVYFVIGMPLGSTPLSWIFCLGIQALPLGIVFMLMYTKVNKKGTVLISGLLLAALLRWNTPLLTALSRARDATRSWASAAALSPASTASRSLRISVRTAERTDLLRSRRSSLVRMRLIWDLMFAIACYLLAIWGCHLRRPKVLPASLGVAPSFQQQSENVTNSQGKKQLT